MGIYLCHIITEKFGLMHVHVGYIVVYMMLCMHVDSHGIMADGRYFGR